MAKITTLTSAEVFICNENNGLPGTRAGDDIEMSGDGEK